jgi:hypothetical protein
MGSLRERRLWLPLLVAAAASVMLILQFTTRDWRWGYSYQVAAGLPQAGAFLRGEGRPGEVFAVQGFEGGRVTADLAVQVVSLTGMPTYLARPFIYTGRGGRRKEIAMQRYAELEGVANEKSAAAALARLRELGIQWYVVAESSRRGPRWDPDRRQAVFVDNMVAVYSTREVKR